MFGQYKWLAIIALAASAFIGTYVYGHSNGVDSERAKWVEAQIKQQNELDLQRARYEALARQLVKRVQDEGARADENYRKWRAAVTSVTRGRVCFDAGATGLWDESLLGQGRVSGSPAGTAKTSSATDTAVLGNAIDNFKQYSECRRQLNALIDWHEQGGKQR